MKKVLIHNDQIKAIQENGEWKMVDGWHIANLEYFFRNGKIEYLVNYKYLLIYLILNLILILCIRLS